MVPPITIYLGLNRTLSKEDLSRALICSIAVYHQSNSLARHSLQAMLDDDPSISFEKVYMSDRTRGQNFLVAYATDAIFIAFKGTDTLRDVASDLMVDSHSKFGGSFHRGFFRRSNTFMNFDLSTPLNPFTDLIGTGKRIIFCGHSLGGAVAHTVLLRFFLEIDVLPTETGYPDSLISISFGAPHICDAHIAQQVNGDENLKWRFVNFVNQSDPVPRLLHNLRSSIAAGLSDCYGEADDYLKCIGGFSGDCTESYAVGGSVGAVRAATIGAARRAGAALCRGVLSFFGDLARRVGSGRNTKEPDFHPVGQYIYVQNDEGHGWVAEQFYGSDHRMGGFFVDLPRLSERDLEYHKATSYRRVLLASSFLDGHRDPVSSAALNRSGRTDLNVSTPTPKVTFAKWAVNEDLTERSIIVRGENLLFLSEHVTVTGNKGQRAWAVSMQTDNELRILDPESPDSKQKVSGSDVALTVIVIKTAFGETRHKSIHKSYSANDSEVGLRGMIDNVLQTVIIMATPPFILDIQTKRLVYSEFDSFMRCAPQFSGKKKASTLSQLLDELRKDSVNGREREIERITHEINYMVRSLVKYLRSTLEVDHSSPVSRMAVKFARNATAVCTVVSAVSGEAGVGVLLGITSIYLKKRHDGMKPKEITDYVEVLKVAIRETSAWSLTPEYMDDELNETQEAAVLEDILFRQVTRSSPEFKVLVAGAHTLDPASLPVFKSKLLRDARGESRLSLLRIIKVVHGVLYLYKTVVEKRHILCVFGAEDAGKSTFIKKVLEKYNPSSTMPMTGPHTHTAAVQPYKVNESFWMVDFPGNDSVETHSDNWERFTALPTSSIFLLDFEGDIKREYQVLYQRMKSMLGSHAQVTIVVNKVDATFSSTHPNERALTFTERYFEDQRTKVEATLGCTGNDEVCMACVEPAIPEDFDELKSLGVLGFEDLVTRLVSPHLN